MPGEGWGVLREGGAGPPQWTVALASCGLWADLRTEAGVTPAQHGTGSLATSAKWLVGGNPLGVGARVLARPLAESLPWLGAPTALGSGAVDPGL